MNLTSCHIHGVKSVEIKRKHMRLFDGDEVRHHIQVVITDNDGEMSFLTLFSQFEAAPIDVIEESEDVT